MSAIVDLGAHVFHHCGPVKYVSARPIGVLSPRPATLVSNDLSAEPRRYVGMELPWWRWVDLARSILEADLLYDPDSYEDVTAEVLGQ